MSNSLWESYSVLKKLYILVKVSSQFKTILTIFLKVKYDINNEVLNHSNNYKILYLNKIKLNIQLLTVFSPKITF